MHVDTASTIERHWPLTINAAGDVYKGFGACELVVSVAPEGWHDWKLESAVAVGEILVVRATAAIEADDKRQTVDAGWDMIERKLIWQWFHDDYLNRALIDIGGTYLAVNNLGCMPKYWAVHSAHTGLLLHEDISVIGLSSVQVYDAGPDRVKFMWFEGAANWVDLALQPEDRAPRAEALPKVRFADDDKYSFRQTTSAAAAATVVRYPGRTALPPPRTVPYTDYQYCLERGWQRGLSWQRHWQRRVYSEQAPAVPGAIYVWMPSARMLALAERADVEDAVAAVDDCGNDVAGIGLVRAVLVGFVAEDARLNALKHPA